MTKLTRILAALVVAGMALALSGIAGAQESPAPTEAPAASPADTAPAPAPADGDKTTFTVGSAYDFVSPNVFKACCTLDYEMLSINYDYLFEFSQETLEPATNIGVFPPEVSEDNKTWTIQINEGIKWSDGTPLTAHDVAFTYNLINDEHLAVYSTELGSPESFEAPDDTTLIWHMKDATLAPLAPPWVPILPEHIWGPITKGKTAAQIKEYRNVPAVGSGPYMLVEWKEGQFARFEKNPYYDRAPIAIDELVYRVITNPEALTLALETGDIDFADGLPPDLFSRLEKNPDITTVEASVAEFVNLAFSFEGNSNPALHDEKVRRAISLAIDRQGLVDRVLQGHGSVGDSVILPVYTRYYQPAAADKVQGYDPEEAKKILDEAGYTDKDGDGVREGPDGPLDIELLSITSQTYSTPAAKLMAGWLNEVGFNATVKTVSESKAYDLWAPKDFDAYVWGWGGGPDPDFMLSIFTTDQCGPAGWSDGCYKDEAYDAMWDEQHTELDPVAREAQVRAMQDYLYEKNPELVLFYVKDLQAYRTDAFEGYVHNPEPNGSVLFQFGPYTYQHLTPVGNDGSGSGSGTGSEDEGGGGSSMFLWIGIAVLLIVLIAVVMMRRGKGAEESE